MNKIFIYILILNFIFTFSGNSYFANAEVAPEEIAEATKLLNLIGKSGNEICEVFECTDISGYQHVTRINIYAQSTVDLSSVDFSVFASLHYLDLNNKVFPPLNILNQLASCSNLLEIQIANLIEGSDVNLSPLLSKIMFGNFKGNFYAKWVQSEMNILSVINSINFNLIGSFGNTPYLTSLDFPVPPNGLQDLSSCFPGLVSVNLFLKESTYSDKDYVPSSYLGSLENFGSSTDLSSIILSFDSNSTSKSLNKLYYLPNFSTLKKLTYFEINGDAFVLEDDQSLNLTLSGPNLNVYISNVENLFKNRPNSYIVPQNSNCYFSYSKIFIDQLDLRNCVNVKLDNIQLKQPLLFSGLDFSKLTTLEVTSSLFYGELPETLCSISYQYLTIKNNLFTKEPSCYTCSSSSEVRNSILPNKFKNFNESHPVYCENFIIDPIQELYLVNTYSDAIYITGRNLGFNFEVNGDYSKAYMTELNKKIQILTPAGNDSGNKTFTVSLPDRNKTLKIIYSYASPFLIGYSVSDSGSLKLYGKNFDYSGSPNNKIYLDNDYALTTSTSDTYTFYVSSLNFMLTENKVYQAYVLVNGRQSNTITVNYSSVGRLKINDASIIFTTDGGNIQLNTNLDYIKTLYPNSNVSVNVGGIDCSIVQLSPLVFSYPKTKQNSGSNILLALKVNDMVAFKFATITLIQDPYVPPPLPNSSDSSSIDSSSQSSHHSSNSSPSQSSSSSDDNVSISFKLKVSFNLILILILIITQL